MLSIALLLPLARGWLRIMPTSSVPNKPVWIGFRNKGTHVPGVPVGFYCRPFLGGESIPADNNMTWTICKDQDILTTLQSVPFNHFKGWDLSVDGTVCQGSTTPIPSAAPSTEALDDWLGQYTPRNETEEDDSQEPEDSTEIPQGDESSTVGDTATPKAINLAPDESTVTPQQSVNPSTRLTRESESRMSASKGMPETPAERVLADVGEAALRRIAGSSPIAKTAVNLFNTLSGPISYIFGGKRSLGGTNCGIMNKFCGNKFTSVEPEYQSLINDPAGTPQVQMFSWGEMRNSLKAYYQGLEKLGASNQLGSLPGDPVSTFHSKDSTPLNRFLSPPSNQEVDVTTAQKIQMEMLLSIMSTLRFLQKSQKTQFETYLIISTVQLCLWVLGMVYLGLRATMTARKDCITTKSERRDELIQDVTERVTENQRNSRSTGPRPRGRAFEGRNLIALTHDGQLIPNTPVRE